MCIYRCLFIHVSIKKNLAIHAFEQRYVQPFIHKKKVFGQCIIYIIDECLL